MHKYNHLDDSSVWVIQGFCGAGPKTKPKYFAMGGCNIVAVTFDFLAFSYSHKSTQPQPVYTYLPAYLPAMSPTYLPSFLPLIDCQSIND
jgi:hypothetical protein